VIPAWFTGKPILRISKWFLCGLTSATPATSAYPVHASGSPILGAPARRTSELGWKRAVVVGRWRNLKGRSVRLKKGLSIVRGGSN
jgi:hypothetical protein